MGSNLVIVAIPDENDPVWQISSEKIPHLTILFLGEVDRVANLGSILDFVEHAANTTLNRFHLTVDRRGTLGEDQADVLFFKTVGHESRALHRFRNALLQNDNIRVAYDSAPQFDGPWQPHLTLGYPDTPATEDERGGIYGVNFTRIAMWVGDFDGPEVLLKDQWDEFMDTFPMNVAMSDLQHFGVKGMKWGQRKTVSVSTKSGKTKLVTAKKAEKLDKSWEKNQFTLSKGIERHNAQADHFNQRIGKINDKYAKDDFSKEAFDSPAHWSPKYKEYVGEVQKLQQAGFAHAVKQVHGSSPTGKKQMSVEVQGDDMRMVVKNVDDKAKHAAIDEGDEVFLYRITRNQNGLITSIEPVNDPEKTMTQTVELGEEFLEHFGVKGMKWGVRRTNTKFSKSEQLRAESQALKDKSPRKAAKKLRKAGDLRADVFSKVMGQTNQSAKKELNALRKRPEFQNINYKDRNNRSKFDIEKFRALDKAEAQIWTKHLNNVVSGYKFKVEVKGETWDLLPEEIKHETTSIVRVKPIRDEDGYLIDVELVDISERDDTLTQSVNLGDTLMSELGFGIEHFGTKGMKWGVRKARAGAQAAGRGVKKIGRGLAALGAHLADSSWQNSTYSDIKHEAVHNRVAKDLDNYVDRLARSPKYRGKDLKADRNLRHEYRQDVAKVTNSAYRRAVKETYGENYTGTKTAHYVTDARGPRIEVRHKKTGDVESEAPLTSKKEIRKRRAAEAAALSHAELPEAPDLVVELKIGADEQITGVGFVQPSNEEELAQSAIELGEAYVLEHFGVRGMKWGVRRNRPAPVAVTPTSVSKVPHGKKRKTKIEVEGGENHPAHDDAIRVAESRAKLKKSGTAALSNQELREVANRLQLENQVAILTSSKGKQFVAKEFETTTKQLTKKGVKKGAPFAARKAAQSGAAKTVKKTAATVAVSALL